EVLLAKLFPFVKECLESRPNTVVLEDGAPAHTHFYQQELYNIHKINRLLWPGNSPDLNMIEPAWMWLCDVQLLKVPHENLRLLNMNGRKPGKSCHKQRFNSGLSGFHIIFKRLYAWKGVMSIERVIIRRLVYGKGQRLKGKLSQQQDLGAILGSWSRDFGSC
ncbi:hypothetical protein CISG_10165, partial [Coccidioides immitis RMSCC 3703]